MTAEPPAVPAHSRAIEEVGGWATLVFRRRLPHSPATVWSALTDPAKVREWFMTDVRGEQRAGGRLELVTGPYRMRSVGRVLVWDPPRCYEYEWNVDARPSVPEGETTIVRWELAPADDGTLLTLTHRHLTLRTGRNYLDGMDAFLDRLEAQLADHPLPDWDRRLKELRDQHADVD